MTVTPQIVVGDLFNGINPDPINTGYAKYNIHDHGQGLVTDVRYYGLLAGSTVQVEDADGNELFPTNTQIVSLDGSTISVDSVSSNLEDLDDVTVIQGAVTIPGCSLLTTSDEITLVARNGFMSSGAIQEANKKVVSTVLTNPGTAAYPILLPSSVDGYVLNVFVAVTVGSITDVQVRWIDDSFSIINSSLTSYTAGQVLDIPFETQTANSNSLISSTRGMAIAFVGASSDAVITVNTILASKLI